ncbi:MAG: hypothetical protein KAW52_01630 [candidate division Zixibacteria bacterium]|nr:hypothetical protein [candidate division Zixibacteria bacterium]
MDTVIQNLEKTLDRFFKSVLWIQNSEKTCVDHKRTNVISETKKILRSKAEVGNQDRFLKNISLAKVWLKATDSILSQLSDFISQVKDMIIRIDKTSNHAVWKQTAKEVEKLLGKILKTAKSQDVGGYLFPQNQSMTSFFQKEERGAVYPGDTGKMELKIEPGSNMRINLVEANFLTKPLRTLGEDFDLEPGIDQNTRLSDLNLGKGVNLVTIRIIDNNAGRSWDINLSCVTTVGEVIDAINSSGIVGLSADINASKKGLKLTYTGLNESNSGQEFTISEAGGTTARDLGILRNLLGDSLDQPGNLEGQDLNPILTHNMPTSLLKSGHGLTLGTIKIALGRTHRIVDLSSASTVGEIINAICNSIPGVIASVNNSKKGINVESTGAGESLVVCDGDDKKSARSLGISGSPDILGTLLFLMEGLNNEDCEAISEGLKTLNLSLEEILTQEAETVAKVKRLENIGTRIMGFQPDTIRVLSEIKDADLFTATTDLADQKRLYQSALQRGGAVIQPTFLDFIR